MSGGRTSARLENEKVNLLEPSELGEGTYPGDASERVLACRLPLKNTPAGPSRACGRSRQWRSVVTDPRTTTKSGAGPTDAVLVIAARAGEAWAQEALFQRYARMVMALAQRMLPERQDADDLVQDVFVFALDRLNTLDNPQAFASWIASIVVRTAGKRLRRRRLLTRLGLLRTTPVDLDAVVSPSAPQDVAAELRSVYSMLNRLPPEERVALVLRRIEGMEIAEIAQHMDISIATVKRRLSAAEARLTRARQRS